MKTIHAVYRDGVFRPREQVDLPECAEVEFEPRVVASPAPATDVERVLSILSETFETDATDLAARHNEHQP